jgi:enoyl-CoA hydratase
MEPKILADVAAGVASITLNRPRALNALDLDMFQDLWARLNDWAGDRNVRLILIRGAGGKAFCAGGDLRAVVEAHNRGDRAFLDGIFRREYSVNHLIHAYAKPYVAFMDGLVMGGGCGMSVHGSHRIVTERTRLAMPETKIGFFPDIGGTYFLSRCLGSLGVYLGLTGQVLGPADALYAGLADACVPSDRLDELAAALGEGVDEAVSSFSVDPGPAPLAAHRQQIDRCFSRHSVGEILKALEGEGEWGRSLRDHLDAMCPFSLVVTHRAIGEARGRSLAQCLTTEYRVCQRFTHRADLYEGIRAAILDKDNAPRWNPNILEDIDPAEVDAYFAPLQDDLLLTSQP